MTAAQVVETSVTVNNNSPIQDYVHPDDQTQPTFERLLLSTSIKTSHKGHNFRAFKCCSFRYKSVAFAKSDFSCVARDLFVIFKP